MNECLTFLDGAQLGLFGLLLEKVHARVCVVLVDGRGSVFGSRDGSSCQDAEMGHCFPFRMQGFCSAWAS